MYFAHSIAPRSPYFIQLETYQSQNLPTDFFEEAKSLTAEHKQSAIRCIDVYTGKHKLVLDGIEVWPVTEYLRALWGKRLLHRMAAGQRCRLLAPIQAISEMGKEFRSHYVIDLSEPRKLEKDKICRMTDKSRSISRRNFLKLGVALGAFGLAGSYPVFIERYIVLINTYKISLPNLPKAFSGLRIVHLTDLHYGFLVPPSFVRSVISRANALGGDVVVCTGDYVHERNSTDQIDAVWPVLSELEAPLGVFSVLGNHDHWADTERSQYWLDQTGQNLRHKTVCIERQGSRLWFAGAGDYWEDHRSLDKVLGEIPESDCRIVLAHNPDSADTKFFSRVDLMLSGHTHGGQVNIPFFGPPILPVKNKTYSSGLKFSPKGERVFISRGIGWAV